MAIERTPIHPAEELDQILDALPAPAPLNLQGSTITPAAILDVAKQIQKAATFGKKDPPLLLPAGVLVKRIHVESWGAAEEKVEKLLKHNPDFTIEVCIGGNKQPSYVVSWPKNRRR